jgi:hypothetical protein
VAGRLASRRRRARAEQGLRPPPLTCRRSPRARPTLVQARASWFHSRGWADVAHFLLSRSGPLRGPLDRARAHRRCRSARWSTPRGPAHRGPSSTPGRSPSSHDATRWISVTSLTWFAPAERLRGATKRDSQEGARSSISRAARSSSLLFPELGAEDRAPLVVHHIVSDLWSSGVLQPWSPRSTAPSSRAGFALFGCRPVPTTVAWRRRWLQGDTLSELLTLPWTGRHRRRHAFGFAVRIASTADAIAPLQAGTDRPPARALAESLKRSRALEGRRCSQPSPRRSTCCSTGTPGRPTSSSDRRSPTRRARRVEGRRRFRHPRAAREALRRSLSRELLRESRPRASARTPTRTCGRAPRGRITRFRAGSRRPPLFRVSFILPETRPGDDRSAA